MIDLEKIDQYIYEGLALISKDSNPCSVCLDNQDLGSTPIHFHGSDLGKCALRVFYKLQNGNSNSDNLDLLTKAQFLDGHLSEKLLVEGLKAFLEFGDFEEIKLEHNPEKEGLFNVTLNDMSQVFITIIGHADVLLTDQNTGKRCIIEMKAVKNYSYKFKFLTGDIGDDYLLQVQAYLHIFDADEAVIIAKNRETTELCKPIKIKKDSELFNEALRRLASVKLHLLNGKTKPSRAYDSKNNYECKYCDYNKKCWG